MNVATPVNRQKARPSLAARVLALLVRGYQVIVSPWFAPRCRFYPSCSAYAVTALRERGAAVGSVLAAYRVLRCNPWARGGVDVVPHRGQRWPSWDGVIDPPSASGAALTEAVGSLVADVTVPDRRPAVRPGGGNDQPRPSGCQPTP